MAERKKERAGRAISAVADSDIPESLIELERKAWAEQQAGALTVATAAAVQAAYTEHAAGRSRYDLEHTVKKIVRYPDPHETA